MFNKDLGTIKDQLLRDEGKVPYAYTDSEGYLTIGVGRLIDNAKGGRLRDDEIDLMLSNDIDDVTRSLHARLDWFDSLDDARKGVLINMAFNLGVNGLLGFRKTISMIERGDYKGASVEMLDSKWARQVKGRATRLSEQMRTGEWV